jgi:hypothetical protein
MSLDEPSAADDDSDDDDDSDLVLDAGPNGSFFSQSDVKSFC